MHKYISILLSLLLLSGCSTASAKAEITGGTTSFGTTIVCNGTDIDANGVGVTVTDQTITIHNTGTYTFTGNLTGNIVVDADNGNVEIVFSDFTVTAETGPALSVEQAESTNLTLEGTNTVSDSANNSADTDAAIYASDDLQISGTGTLTVNGNYENGIHGKDTLSIMGTTITVNAVKNGIVGKDALYLSASTLTITAGQDGLKANNDTDDDMGNMSIDGCEIMITAGDDGIQARHSLQISSSTDLNITAVEEGIEAEQLTIYDGNITIKAGDDGINTTVKEESTGNAMMTMDADDGSKLIIHGGNITVDADGDGIDLNGSGKMDGGILTIYGPSSEQDGALDYNGTFVVTGGTILAGGSSMMVQAPSNGSSLYSLSISATGGTVSIQDSTGKELANYTSPKSFENLIYTSSALQKGSEYSVYQDGTLLGTVTVESSVTTVGNAASMGRKGRF